MFIAQALIYFKIFDFLLDHDSLWKKNKQKKPPLNRRMLHPVFVASQ